MAQKLLRSAEGWAVVESGQPAPLTEADTKLVEGLARKGKAGNTTRAYESGIREFENWLAIKNYTPTVDSVIAFLGYLTEAGAKTSTIKLKRAAIVSKYEFARDKRVTEAVSGIINTRADASKAGDDEAFNASVSRSKAHISIEDLRKMCQDEPDTLKAVRDRAVLLYTFWTGSRRSETVALRLTDIEWRKEGATISVRFTKTSRTGTEQGKPLPLLKDKSICPVTALKNWIEIAKIKDGFVFRQLQRRGNTMGVLEDHIDGQLVALVVKDACRSIGLDPALFSAHSLRSGFVTSASEVGLERRHIKNFTHHKTDAMLDHYDKRDVVDSLKALKALVDSL